MGRGVVVFESKDFCDLNGVLKQNLAGFCKKNHVRALNGSIMQSERIWLFAIFFFG